MSNDLEEAVRFALQPMVEQDRLELCVHCGMMRHRLGEHTCRSNPLEFPGDERDEKRRARSYAIE